MHSHIAYHLADQRHAELIAEAAHQRLIDQAKQASAGLAGRRRVVRRRWWVLGPNQATGRG